MKFCRTNKYVKELEDKVDRHANTFIWCCDNKFGVKNKFEYYINPL